MGYLPELTWMLEVAPEIKRKLRKAARKRNLTVDKVAQLILEKVAEDDLVNAVLDDTKV